MSSRSRSRCSCWRSPAAEPGGDLPPRSSTSGRLRGLLRELRVGRCGVDRPLRHHQPPRAGGSVLLRLNLLLLFFVSVLPFPTKMLAEYMRDFGPERIAVTIYGLNLLAMSAMTSVVWRHAVGERMLDEHPQEEVQEVTKKLTPSLGFYAAAIAIGLLEPRLAVFLYLGISALSAHPIPRGLAAPAQADPRRLDHAGPRRAFSLWSSRCVVERPSHASYIMMRETLTTDATTSPGLETLYVQHAPAP